MIHDRSLLDKLSAFSPQVYSGTVFRATRVSADPIASSINGGRWSLPPNGGASTDVLYTSTTRDGAIAEVVSFLADLNPVPKGGQLKVTELDVSASQTLTLVRSDLQNLGVDLTRYGERDYSQTQKIGAALAFLGFDGLLVPSARWNCDNLVLFMENHKIAERLSPLRDELIDWKKWGEEKGLIR